jgi:hypothetical protein
LFEVCDIFLINEKQKFAVMTGGWELILKR